MRLTLALPLLLLLSAASAEASSITVAWNPNPEPDIAGYIVEYATQPGLAGTQVDVGLTTTWTLQNVSTSQSYYFYVIAYNTSGARSARSAQAVAMPTTPVMSVDTPTENLSVRTPFSIGGWAGDLASTIDSGVDAVHVWAFPTGGQSPIFLGAAQMGLGRPDVAAGIGPQFADSGFYVPVGNMTPGQYDIVVYARSRIAEAFNNSRAIRVTVLGPDTRPMLAVDTIRDNQNVSTRFAISGWAIDGAATDGSTGVDTIHVWAYPVAGGPGVFVGVGAMGGNRPDVAALFGTAFRLSGYTVNAQLAAGSYALVISARSKITNTFSASVQLRVNVVRAQPLMSIDTPANNATVPRNFTISGWAIDPEAPSGTGVDVIHVWAYPQAGGAAVWVGAPTLGLSRADVGAAFGSRFSTSGYRLAATLPPGRYQLVVFAHSSASGTFNNNAVVNITVQ